MYSILDKILDIGIALKEPKQFMNDTLCKHLLRCKHRKSFLKVKPQLRAKNRTSFTCAGILFSAFLDNSVHKVKILLINMVFPPPDFYISRSISLSRLNLNGRANLFPIGVGDDIRKESVGVLHILCKHVDINTVNQIKFKGVIINARTADDINLLIY